MTQPSLPPLSIHPTRLEMGRAAARHFQSLVEAVVRAKSRCRIIVGCAPSQDEFFAALVKEALAAPEMWRQVEVFHMDEYVGLPDEHPESFRSYLRRNFLNKVAVARFHPIPAEQPNPADEAARYATLLGSAPIDVIAMGIGENGHVAFNDPPVADFADPVLVKIVEMDRACRQQQVNDGCFPTLAEVPQRAITITLPVFAGATSLCAIVPGPRKARAVRDAFLGPVGTSCPATVLRMHPRVRVFLDQDSAALYQAEIETQSR